MNGNPSYLNNYCQQKVAPRGSSIYYSTLYSTTAQRESIYAVRAFHQELGDIIFECTDPQVAQAKLAFWHNEISQLLTGFPQHPLTQALQKAQKLYALPQELFQEVLTGFSSDLKVSIYQNIDDLRHFYHHTAGATERLIGLIQGITDQQSLAICNELGIYIQRITHFRDCHRAIKHNHFYFPAELLLEHQVTLKQLSQLKMIDSVQNLFKAYADDINQQYQNTISSINSSSSKQLLPSIILGKIYKKLLAEIIAADYPVLQYQLSLTPLRKFWIAWRTKLTYG